MNNISKLIEKIMMLYDLGEGSCVLTTFEDPKDLYKLVETIPDPLSTLYGVPESILQYVEEYFKENGEGKIKVFYIPLLNPNANKSDSIVVGSYLYIVDAKRDVSAFEELNMLRDKLLEKYVKGTQSNESELSS